MLAMRCGRSCIRRGNREVVQTALGGIATGDGDVVIHHRSGEFLAFGHASGLVGPFHFTRVDGDIAEAFAEVSAECRSAARGACVHAMRGRILRCCARVINAAAEGIALGIRIGSRRER